MDDHECPGCNLRMKSAHADDVLWMVYVSGEFRVQVCTKHLTDTLELLRHNGEANFSLSYGPRPPLKTWEGTYGPVDEWAIERHVHRGWTLYQRELIDHAYLHGVVGWDDEDPFGKRWNRATVSALMDILKEDEAGKYRALLTEAGEEVGKRLKERE